MVYSWKNFNYSVDANVVGKEFEKIEKKYGALTNENVLKSAESEKSPIHNIFEWDDALAAHNYRLQQATKLICNLTCEVEKDEEIREVRAYFDVSEGKKGTFINVDSAFKNVDTREIVLKRAYAELKAFENKYRELTELSELFNAIDDLVEKGA